MNTNNEYIDALDRLMLIGVPINLDAVSLEAGRKRGSIKRGRASQSRLVNLIDEAAHQQSAVPAEPLVQVKKRPVKPPTKKLNESDVLKSATYQKLLQKLISIQYENHRLRMKILAFEGEREP